MKYLKFFLRKTIAIMTLFIVIFGYSRDIYVATTGSNTNSGTISSPYKTITFAATKAVEGDNVFVRAGTYSNASFGGTDKWSNEKAISIFNLRGTAANYITFQPYNGETVIIQSDSTYGVLIKDSSYIKFIGFEVRGVNQNITQSEACSAWGLYINPSESGTPIHNLATELNLNPCDASLIGQTINKTPFSFNETRPSYYNGRGVVANSSHHIEIRNNTIHDFPSSGIRAEGCDYITIAGNTVYNNTFYTSAGVGAITVASSDHIDTYNGVKFIIEKNKVYNNENRMVSWNGSKSFITFEIDEGSGIFFTRNNDTAAAAQYDYGYFLIRNNLSYNNGASGIVIHITNRAIVQNNTLYYNGAKNTGNPGGIGMNTVNDLTIKNNVVYARPNKFALGIVGLPANNVKVQGNIIYNENGSTAVTNKVSSTYITNYTATNGGWQVANPLFMNTTTPNLKLTSTSPAINYGNADVNTPTDDIEGNVRTGNPDAGAYEYTTTLTVDNFSSENLKIYPNPAKEVLTISGIEVNEYEVYSVDGKNVTGLVKTIDKADKSLKLNVSNLKSGIYLIKTSQGSYKFLKN